MFLKQKKDFFINTMSFFLIIIIHIIYNYNIIYIYCSCVYNR